MYRFSTASFRAPGVAATTQNLFALWNGSTKRRILLRKLTVQVEATAVLAAVAAVIRSCRIAAAPTGGTALQKVPFGSMASDAGIIALGGIDVDGGTASAIVSTPGHSIWSTFANRIHTAVGQIIPLEYSLLPGQTEDDPLTLAPGEGILVHLLGAATAANPITNHYLIQSMWDEQEQ